MSLVGIEFPVDGDMPILILGRPASIQRCHRCGKLLVPDPRIIRGIVISNYGGGRYVTCMTHPFPRPQPQGRRRVVVWAGNEWRRITTDSEPLYEYEVDEPTRWDRTRNRLKACLKGEKPA